MLELARYASRRRVRGSAVLSAGAGAFAALVIWIYPSFRDAMDLDQLLEAYPEPFLRAFGVETLATIEGFLATEFYNFVWVLLLGLYVAYAAAETIAADVERGRIDVLLALPVSRARYVAEQYLSLLVPIVLVNAVAPAVIFVATRLVEDPVGAVDLLAVHALSIPYFLACAAIGLVASVAFDRATIAQRVAILVAFALFLVESLLADTDYEAAGAIAPMRYYDPNAILINGSYDLVGALVLLAMAGLLVAASQWWFGRKDL